MDRLLIRIDEFKGHFDFTRLTRLGVIESLHFLRPLLNGRLMVGIISLVGARFLREKLILSSIVGLHLIRIVWVWLSWICEVALVIGVVSCPFSDYITLVCLGLALPIGLVELTACLVQSVSRLLFFLLNEFFNRFERRWLRLISFSIACKFLILRVVPGYILEDVIFIGCAPKACGVVSLLLGFTWELWLLEAVHIRTCLHVIPTHSCALSWKLTV